MIARHGDSSFDLTLQAPMSTSHRRASERDQLHVWYKQSKDCSRSPRVCGTTNIKSSVVAAPERISIFLADQGRGDLTNSADDVGVRGRGRVSYTYGTENRNARAQTNRDSALIYG